MPSLSRTIPLSIALRLYRRYHSDDVLTASLVRKCRSPSEFLTNWKAGGGLRHLAPGMLQDLISPDRIPYNKPDCWRKEEFNKWTRMGPQGYGIKMFKGDRISNSWIGRRGRFWWNEA